MKFTVDRDTFEKQVFAAQNVAESKGAIQILGYILIEAAENQVVLKATDLDLSITIEMEADVQESGSILLNARTLYETVKKGINSSVILETNEQNHCHINTGTQYELVGLESTEFPELPETDAVESVLVSREAFAESVRKTIYAASDSEARAALSGIYMEPTEEGLRLVSTDGHRLALSILHCDAIPSADGGIILGRKGIQEVIKSIPSVEEEIRIGLVNRFAYFGWTNVRCTLRLVNADFPSYDQVIPKELPHKVVLDRQSFIDSIGRVSTVSSDRFNSLKMHFVGGEQGSLELSCNNFEQGESTDMLAVDYKDEEAEVGFNIKYILQAASTFKSDEIQISFRDHLGAATLQDPADASTLAVVMPLRI